MVYSNSSDKGTKSSHTVPRAYLKTFARHGKLWVKSKKDDKIFPLSTGKASINNDIYELEEKISEGDLYFYKQLLYSQKKCLMEKRCF